MVSKLQRTLQGCLNHKQQRRDKWGTQLNKSTTQKMTKETYYFATTSRLNQKQWPGKNTMWQMKNKKY